MGANIGNPRHLQQALHSTVLSILSMEHGEHHIDSFPDNGLPLEAQNPLAANRGNGRPTVPGMGFPGSFGQHGIILAAKQDPVPLLGDAQGKDIVFALVQVVQHGFRRAQGNLMLGADSAKQDADILLFHIIASFKR